jgi:hypothetical protein
MDECDGGFDLIQSHEHILIVMTIRLPTASQMKKILHLSIELTAVDFAPVIPLDFLLDPAGK